MDRRGGAPEELLQPFQARRSIIRGELDEELRRRLFGVREQRPRPLRDDKAVTSGNGCSSRRWPRQGGGGNAPPGGAATRLAEFLLGPLSDEEVRRYRTYREGQAKNTGFLEDYADVANGLYELHVATVQLRWLEEANRLAGSPSSSSATTIAAASSSRRLTASG